MNCQAESLFRFGDETTSSVPLCVGPTEWKHLNFIRTRILLLLKHSLWIFLMFVYSVFFFFRQILQERRDNQIQTCTRFRPKSATFSQTGFFIFKTTPTL